MSLKSQHAESPGSRASSAWKRDTASTKVSDDDEVTEEKGVIKRKSRNLSEKKRRDQFNILINELCSMVGSGKRKMDKSTILKTAISYIRNHNQVTQQSHSQEAIQEDWKPSFLSNEEFTHLMLEALDEFLIVFSANGRILYVSEDVTSLLHHSPTEMVGASLKDFVWEGERSYVESVLNALMTDHVNGRENQLDIRCHFRRKKTNGDEGETTYELVALLGYTRMHGDPQMSSRMSWSDDSKENTQFVETLTSYNGLIFVASIRLQTPQLLVEMSFVDVSKSEFTSRHSLEWKFLFLDHRGPPIIGYLPFEVLGTSGYDYYHMDDLEKVALCHETLMKKGEVTSCRYRFLTKGQQWIWLQTKYYITYHQWYSKPEFIVCSHRVISSNDAADNAIRGDTEDVIQPLETPNQMDLPPTPRQSAVKSPNRHSSSKSRKTSRPMESSSKPRHRSRDDEVFHRQRPQSRSNGDGTEPESPRGSLQLDSGPQSRHPSDSSRAGTAMSDNGSITSSGSFQSAASQHSQHSRQSDQSMHSIHSQQSHHSMQSVHGHQSNRPSQNCSGQSCVNTSHHHHSRQPTNPFPPQQPAAMQLRFAHHQSHSRSDEATATTTAPPISSIAGHRFAQPRVNAVTGIRRGAGAPFTAASSSNAVSSASGSFAYPVDNAASVSMPVQRIVEGLPVVTLPGIVTHEPLVLTAAQVNLRDQLRLKHLEIQQAIMSQQEELRIVSDRLMMSHYGTWGPTLVQMAVPYANDGNSVNQQSHAVVAFTTESHPVTFSQFVSSPSGLSSLALSPGTSILVQSPDYQLLPSPPDVQQPDLHTLTSTVRTGNQQQEALVQLSQQDIQRLLQNASFIP